MRKSILVDDMEYCYLCGRPKDGIHHVLHGSRRAVADKLHLVIPLCNDCHTLAPYAVHHNPELDERLKRWAQRVYESKHSHEEWMKKVGKSYL